VWKKQRRPEQATTIVPERLSFGRIATKRRMPSPLCGAKGILPKENLPTLLVHTGCETHLCLSHAVAAVRNTTAPVLPTCAGRNAPRPAQHHNFHLPSKCTDACRVPTSAAMRTATKEGNGTRATYCTMQHGIVAQFRHLCSTLASACTSCTCRGRSRPTVGILVRGCNVAGDAASQQPCNQEVAHKMGWQNEPARCAMFQSSMVVCPVRRMPYTLRLACAGQPALQAGTTGCLPGASTASRQHTTQTKLLLDPTVKRQAAIRFESRAGSRSYCRSTARSQKQRSCKCRFIPYIPIPVVRNGLGPGQIHRQNQPAKHGRTYLQLAAEAKCVCTDECREQSDAQWLQQSADFENVRSPRPPPTSTTNSGHQQPNRCQSKASLAAAGGEPSQLKQQHRFTHSRMQHRRVQGEKRAPLTTTTFTKSHGNVTAKSSTPAQKWETTAHFSMSCTDALKRAVACSRLGAWPQDKVQFQWLLPPSKALFQYTVHISHINIRLFNPIYMANTRPREVAECAKHRTRRHAV
jgi:hypothetical protein